MSADNRFCGANNAETGTFFIDCNDTLTFGCYFNSSAASHGPFNQCPQGEKTEPTANSQDGKETYYRHIWTGVSTKPTSHTNSDNKTADDKLTTSSERGLFIGVGVGTAVVLTCVIVLLILLQRYCRIHVRTCSERTQESLQLTQSKNGDHAPYWYAEQENLAYNSTDYREADVEVCSHAAIQKERQERGSGCETNKPSKVLEGRCDGEIQHRNKGTDISKPKYKPTRKHMNKDRDHIMVVYSLAVDVERHQEIDIKTQGYDETGYDTTFPSRLAHCIEGNVYNKSSTEDGRNVDNVTACK